MNTDNEYDKRLEDQGWEAMAKILDKEQPKAALPFLRFLPYAATLLIGAFGGYLLWNNSPTSVVTSKTATNKSIQKQPRSYQSYAYNSGGVTDEVNSATNQTISPTVQLDLFAATVAENNDIALSYLAFPNASLVANNTPELPNLSIPVLKQGSPVVAEQATSESLTDPITELSSDLLASNDLNIDLQNFSLDAEDYETARTDANTLKGAAVEGAKKSKTGKQGIVIPITLKSTALDKEQAKIKMNGSLGLVSSSFEKYGARVGVGFSKPLNDKLSVASGVRYSRYQDQYSQTYDVSSVPSVLSEKPIISDLKQREVSRDFVEVPLYLDYKVNDIARLKAGFSVTYNDNSSSDPAISPLTIANSSLIDNVTKLYAPKLYSDDKGYLGEAVMGATINVDKIAVDAEVMKGLISNQDIDNRSVVGVRVSYTFGNR